MGGGWEGFRNWVVPRILLMPEDLHNFRGELRVLGLGFGRRPEIWVRTDSRLAGREIGSCLDSGNQSLTRVSYSFDA